MRSRLSNSYFDFKGCDPWLNPVTNSDFVRIFSLNTTPKAYREMVYLVEDRAVMELTGALPSEVWA